MTEHKKNNSKIVNNNILEGRKIYNNIWKPSFKKFALTGLISTSILSLIGLVYYIMNFNLTLIVVFLIILISLPLLILLITYPLFKRIYFPYEEIMHNGESFILFASSDSLGSGYYNPCFHVVYQGKEYSETRQSTYAGKDIILASLETLFNTGAKNLNFLEININSETLGNVRCVFVLATKKFFIYSALDKNKTNSSNQNIK